MNHLDVGVDKGFSKTNLAVARADGRLLLEARLEHFDQSRKPPITDERLLYLIAQYLIPFKGSPLSLFVGGCVESSRSIFDRLRGSGFDIQVLEIFTDVHAHYGLTAMPGNAVTVACGSHWNAMYYDRANHVHCFASPRAIWDEVPHSFEGITFARFLLAWWCQAWDRGTQTPLANAILARTGLSATALREQVEQDPMLDTLSPPRWLALGPLISQHASEGPIVSFLDQGVNQLQQLYERFCAQVKPASPPWLVLGGSIWSRVLFERVQGMLAHVGIPLKHSQGNPAWGAVRFRRTNPAVQLEPWAFRFTRPED
jgi:hypothetical protein